MLHNIQFTSERRRQAVLVEFGGKILVIMKGSDSEVKNFTKGGLIEDKILQHVVQFAKEGFRTMVIAQRELDRDFLEIWIERLVHFKSENNKHEIRLLEAQLERDFRMVGAIGIEDELQD